MHTMPPNSSSAHTSNVGVLHSGNKIHKPELVQKIGGVDILKQAVNNFYDRLTADPAIKVYFEGADLEVLRWHQFNLMSIAFHDIPEGFDIRDLILRRHPRLFEAGLNGKTYDCVLEHFSGTLRDLKVPEESIQDALSVVQPYRVIFEDGAQMAAAKKKKEETSNLLWRCVIGAAVAVYVGSVIVARRRK